MVDGQFDRRGTLTATWRGKLCRYEGKLAHYLWPRRARQPNIRVGFSFEQIRLAVSRPGGSGARRGTRAEWEGADE
jgi:hypothetical protein